MFQWLSRLVWHDDFIEESASGGLGGRLTRLVKQHGEEEKKQRHEQEVRARLEWERHEQERS